MDRRQSAVGLIRTDILGLPVDNVDMSVALAQIRRMLAGDSTNIVVAVNPEKVIAAQDNPGLLRSIKNADLAIPDGIGVVIAARLLGRGRMQRVPGADLMPEICAIAAVEGHSVFLFGAKPGVAETSAALLKDRYTGLNVVGTQHGYIGDEKMDELVETINDSQARVLFVGLGSPKQEIWMDKYREHLSVRVCQGVGGTFDAICGTTRRAPSIIRRLHLEWLFRLIEQPSRVRRQTALPRYAAQIFRQWISRTLR